MAHGPIENLRRGPRPNPRGLVDIRFKAPRGVYDSVTLICGLTGERRHEWLRRMLLDAIDRALSVFPVRYCWIRPGTTIYSLDRGAFIPIARAVGGERAWPIEVVEMPGAISPTQHGWRMDVTSEEGGYEGRGVYASLESVVGAPPVPTTHPSA